MEYGNHVRVINEENTFLGLVGVISVVAGDLITTKIETNGKDASGKAHTMQADTQMKYLGSDCGSVRPLDQQMKAMQSQAPAKALAAPRAPGK